MALAQEVDVNLWEPSTSDVVLKLQTDRMTRMVGLGYDSGIDKTIRERPVRLPFMGLDADEHDPTFHGSVDKAVYGCSSFDL